jgi:DNA gyrase inhibitor GyrI
MRTGASSNMAPAMTDRAALPVHSVRTIGLPAAARSPAPFRSTSSEVGPLTADTVVHRLPLATIGDMAGPTLIDVPELTLAYVQAVGGLSGARAAFEQLERRMSTLRGQRMYGVVYPGDPVRYLAGLLLDDEDADDMGLDRTTVPAGRYARTLVHGWETRIPELPSIVEQLQSDMALAGLAVDPGRPMLEYYRRIDELLMMVPVRPDHAQN